MEWQCISGPPASRSCLDSSDVTSSECLPRSAPNFCSVAVSSLVFGCRSACEAETLVSRDCWVHVTAAEAAWLQWHLEVRDDCDVAGSAVQGGGVG